MNPENDVQSGLSESYNTGLFHTANGIPWAVGNGANDDFSGIYYCAVTFFSTTVSIEKRTGSVKSAMGNPRKINGLLVWLCVNMWCASGLAQIPVEISVGHAGYYYQHAFAAKFNAEKSLGFFHASSVLIPYNKKRGNEIMSQSYLSYTMSKRWTSGVGAILTPVNRVRPSVFLQYFLKGKTTSVLVFPRIDAWSDPTLELMGFFEYQGVKSRPVNLYARFQYMTTWNRNGHGRSYQYARAGIDAGGIQVGLAVNFDQYGRLATNYGNVGLFARKVF